MHLCEACGKECGSELEAKWCAMYDDTVTD